MGAGPPLLLPPERQLLIYEKFASRSRFRDSGSFRLVWPRPVRGRTDRDPPTPHHRCFPKARRTAAEQNRPCTRAQVRSAAHRPSYRIVYSQ